MPLDDSLEALAPARANDIHALAVDEDRDVDLVTRLDRVATRLELDFPPYARGRNAGLLEVTLRRLVLAGGFRLDQPELHGLVSVGLYRLHLRHDARTGLE